jgi:hypothetical protein
MAPDDRGPGRTETLAEERARFIDFIRAGVESLKSGRIVTREEMRRRIDDAFAAEDRAEKQKTR